MQPIPDTSTHAIVRLSRPGLLTHGPHVSAHLDTSDICTANGTDPGRYAIDVARPGFSSTSNLSAPCNVCAAGDEGTELALTPAAPRCFRPREQLRNGSSDTLCRKHPQHRSSPRCRRSPRTHRCSTIKPSFGTAQSAFHLRCTSRAHPLKGKLRSAVTPRTFRPVSVKQHLFARACTPRRVGTPKGPCELDSWWNSRGSSPQDTKNRVLPEGFCNRDDPRAQPASFPSLAPTPKGSPHPKARVRRLPDARSE
jgi:hypothetical protein